MVGGRSATLFLTGGTGMLGRAVAHYFRRAGWEVRAPGRAALDLASPPEDRALRTLLSGCDAVINAGGLTNRYLELGEAAMTAVNSRFPHLLAAVATDAGLPMIHISTDCVFDGSGGPYDESSPATATDLYGRSKHAGEPPGVLVLRASFIGPETRAFHNLLCWALAQPQDAPVSGYENHLWNGLTTLEMARLCAAYLQPDLYAPGVRHLFGEQTGKDGLIRAIYTAFGRDPAQVCSVTAPQDRDMRLASRFARPPVAPMAQQLADLREVSDDLGRWLA